MVDPRRRQPVRKQKVRHVPLPGIGERFELAVAEGGTVSVISQRSGRRQLALGVPGNDEPTAIISLTRAEAAAVAALLVGAQIELTTDGD
jgi:K+/H+ antiporter YhaU regulatory subunit KhtT